VSVFQIVGSPGQSPEIIRLRQVAAAEEELDDGDGGGVERTEGRAVAFFMGREKVRPAVMDELPERRGAGAAGLMDGRHKECVSEHLW
jgi:hypothetical protein